MRNLRKDIVSRSSVGSIQIHGAKTHNLRDVTVCIPKHALVASPGFLVLEKLPWYLLWQPGHNKPCPRFFRLLCKLG